MTSTPTACPMCKDSGLPCVHESHWPKPRQPDTRLARDAAADEYADRISNTLESANARARSFKAGADWATAQMGAENDRLRRIISSQPHTENTLLRQQLAAAQAKCEAYEKCLKTLNVQAIINGQAGQQAVTAMICEALAAHKRPTKEAADE